VAHFAGVQLCGSVWSCPTCGPHIRQERALDADRACGWWLQKWGTGSVMLLTLTLPHDFGEALAELLLTVRASFSALMAGRRWQADKARFALAHYIRAHDATVGENGWHPHIHLVLLAERALSLDELRALELRLYERWAGAVVSRGHKSPSRAHGCQLEQARDRGDVARYVCQVVTGEEERPRSVALELARGDLKQSRHEGHRSPWEVLAALAETGDCADLQLWHEWERATRGVQAIRWSKGLRALVGLGQEQSDEEIVAAEIGGETLYRFSCPEWRAVCETRGARGELLELAEEGGALAVARRVAAILRAWELVEARRLWREAA
jgi:hypothetical protein